MIPIECLHMNITTCIYTHTHPPTHTVIQYLISICVCLHDVYNYWLYRVCYFLCCSTCILFAWFQYRVEFELCDLMVVAGGGELFIVIGGYFVVFFFCSVNTSMVRCCLLLDSVCVRHVFAEHLFVYMCIVLRLPAAYVDF